MDSYQPTLFSTLQGFAYDLSAGVLTIVVSALLAVGVWSGYRGLPFLRILRALKTAPQVAVSGGRGATVVKVVGRAYPGQETPEGFATPDHVWRTTAKLDTRSNINPGGTKTYSVAPILVRDESAECLIDVLQAQVLHSDKKGTVDRHFGGDATYYTEKSIRTGDTVLAIGVLGTAKQRPGHDRPRCTLRRSPAGVLMVSGQNEAGTLRWLHFRFWPRASLAGAALLFALWLAREHLATYPEPALASYIDTMLHNPWTQSPGFVLRAEEQPPPKDIGEIPD